MQPVWLCILWCRPSKETYENTQWRENWKNATNVTMRPLRQAIWEDIFCKDMVKKNQNKCVIIHPLVQVICGHILKHSALYCIAMGKQLIIYIRLDSVLRALSLYYTLGCHWNDQILNSFVLFSGLMEVCMNSPENNFQSYRPNFMG